MKRYNYSAMRYPSIKQHSNKHLAFIDPSKAEEDKLCEEYLKEMIELNRELSSKLKPYNQNDIQRSDLITTSMKDEVSLKQIIQDLAIHQDNPVSARYLKEEQEQAEKRARRHYMLFQDNLYNAFIKEKFYKKRPHLSHGTCIKLLIIMQCNLVHKLKYPSESMHVNGILLLLTYTAFYILMGVPMQFAMRALSQFSKSSVISMWNFCPLLKGTGAMMLCYTVYFMLRSVAYSAVLVYVFIDVLRGNIGWLECQIDLGEDCSTTATNVTRNLDCLAFAYNNTKEPIISSSGISYFNNVMSESFSDYDISLKWEGLLALLAVWFFILLFMVAGFEKFVQIAESLFVPIILTGVTVIAVMLGSGSSSANGLTEFFDIEVFYKDYFVDHMVFGGIFFDCMVSSGIINFLAAHAPHFVDPMVDTYIFAITDLIITYCLTLATFAAAGFLQTHYVTRHPSCFLVYRDVTLFGVIPEYLARLSFGKLWIFNYLIFILLSQLIFITTAGHMIVNSLIDLFATNVESTSHSSLIFLLVGCGFTYNIFYDFAHGQKIMEEVHFTFTIVELIVIVNFVVAVVFMYSSTALCNNVYLITNARPSAYCEFSLKLCFLLVLIFGTNYAIISFEKNRNINLLYVSQMLLVAILPVVISIMNRISNVFHKPTESLFGFHEDWCVNSLVKDADPTRPRYEKILVCTHRCLRQYMFNHFEEARLQSLRKCFAIAYAPYLYENIET